MLFFWFFKNCELIRDSSLWRSNFIPLDHDSIIIIGSRSVTYTFGSRFACKRWVKVFYQNLNFSFLGQVFQYFCWVSKRVYWGSHQKSIHFIQKEEEEEESETNVEGGGRWVNFYLSHFFHFHFPLDYKIHHQNHPLTKKTPLFKISYIFPSPSPSPQKSLNQIGCKRKFYL